MGLMTGNGPLGRDPAGRFNFEPPAPGRALYLDPSPKRIRAVFGGETIADSTRALMLHESGHQPVYYFPLEDVRADLLEPSERHTRCPKKGEASYHTIKVGDQVLEAGAWYYPDPLAEAAWLKGLIAFYFNRIDHWYEEDEEIFVHPRDPYHRVDVRASDRHVRISLNGELLADSTRARALFETNLPTRWYLPAEDVGADTAAQRHDHRLPLQGMGELPLGGAQRRRGRQGRGLVLRPAAGRGRRDRRDAVLLQREGRPRARRRARAAAGIAVERRRQVPGGQCSARADARLTRSPGQGGLVPPSVCTIRRIAGSVFADPLDLGRRRA